MFFSVFVIVVDFPSENISINYNIGSYLMEISNKTTEGIL